MIQLGGLPIYDLSYIYCLRPLNSVLFSSLSLFQRTLGPESRDHEDDVDRSVDDELGWVKPGLSRRPLQGEKSATIFSRQIFPESRFLNRSSNIIARRSKDSYSRDDFRSRFLLNYSLQPVDLQPRYWRLFLLFFSPIFYIKSSRNLDF